MATIALPTFAKVAELRLRVSSGTDDALRVITRREPVGPSVREHWRGQILFAPMTRVKAAELAAFFEALDGRLLPFKMPLAAWSHTAPFGLSLASAPALASGTLSVTPSGSGGLRAGTLVSVGDIDTAAYQVLEVLDPVASGGSPFAVSVAPRVRCVFSAAASIVVGNPYGKFRLASDALNGLKQNLSHGTATIEVVECFDA